MLSVLDDCFLGEQREFVGGAVDLRVKKVKSMYLIFLYLCKLEEEQLGKQVPKFAKLVCFSTEDSRATGAGVMG